MDMMITARLTTDSQRASQKLTARTVIAACVTTALLIVGPVRDAESQQTDAKARAAAEQLMPLLQQLRKRLQSPGLGVQPGTLPPSPFTGRSSAAVAVTVGRQPVKVDPKVLEAMDRLLDWDRKLGAGEDTTLFLAWLHQLKLKVTSVGPPEPDPLACDTACTVARLTKPGERFGKSRAEREQTRDQVLLFALADALEDVESP